MILYMHKDGMFKKRARSEAWRRMHGDYLNARADARDKEVSGGVEGNARHDQHHRQPGRDGSDAPPVSSTAGIKPGPLSSPYWWNSGVLA